MASAPGALAGKDLLLEVACDLFMKAGYDGVSMQQIADAAHMTKGSPYYHFEGKEDLFAQAFVKRMDQIYDGFMRELQQEADLRTRLTRSLAYLLMTADAGMIRLVEDFHRCVTPDRARQCDAQKLDPAEMLGALTPCFVAATQAGTPLKFDPERAAMMFFSLQMGTMHTLHIMNQVPGNADEARRLADETVDCFLNGVVAAGDH